MRTVPLASTLNLNHFSNMTISPCNKIALALDNESDLSKIKSLITATMPWIGVYKIGLEQFIRFGPPVLETVRATGRKIFLDLKLHDIPNTVAKAVSAACDLGVDFLTLHTQGGSAMMRAAIKAKQNHPGNRLPKIIGVTILTSIDTTTLHDELHVDDSIENHVLRLARLSAASGMDGIVCSAAELPFVAPILPKHFDIITPGIRPPGIDVNDQKRIATPAEAIHAGATMLVLGRAITGAADPATAAELVFNEITSATA
jgi:orotidine-5'-phosphate decarboxylase